MIIIQIFCHAERSEASIRQYAKSSNRSFVPQDDKSLLLIWRGLAEALLSFYQTITHQFLLARLDIYPDVIIRHFFELFDTWAVFIHKIQ